MALVKFCGKAGCNRLVPLGVKYCKVHTLAGAADNKERHKTYDMYCRDQKAKAFYSSTEWQYTRAAVLTRDNHIDIYKYIIEGRIVPASTVHHITELSEDYSQRCHMDNLISVSEGTHSMIGKVYKDIKRKKYMQDRLRECIKEYKKRLALEGV